MVNILDNTLRHGSALDFLFLVNVYILGVVKLVDLHGVVRCHGSSCEF